MPVPFGVSVGDFIAGIEFIQSVCEALESATGSKAQYQGVIEALQSVRDALTQLSILQASAQEKSAVNKIIDRIKQTLLRYDAKINKYKASLGKDKTTNRWTAISRKIQWQRYSKDDVLWFQNEIVQHLSSLQIILSKIQNAANYRVAQTTDGLLTRIEQHITQSASSLQAQSAESETIIRFSVDQCRLATLSGFQQTENTARQLHSESEAAAHARFEITLAILLHVYRDIRRGMFLFCICVMNSINLVHQIMSRLPPRMLTQASTIFEDTHGFICHINTQFIQSWRAFNYVMRDNFRGRPGLLRVTIGKYRLHDRFASNEINVLQTFHAVFRPGRHIRQSILFEWNEVPGECCPKCKHEQAVTIGTEIECNECGLWYRKLHSSGEDRSSQLSKDSTAGRQISESSGKGAPIIQKRRKAIKDLSRPEHFLRIAVSARPKYREVGWHAKHRVARRLERSLGDQKIMLSRALQRANAAILLDNAQNYEAAADAYDDACELLQVVIDRSSDPDDKKKLDNIKTTYVCRIEELRSMPPRHVIESDGSFETEGSVTLGRLMVQNVQRLQRGLQRSRRGSREARNTTSHDGRVTTGASSLRSKASNDLARKPMHPPMAPPTYMPQISAGEHNHWHLHDDLVNPTPDWAIRFLEQQQPTPILEREARSYDPRSHRASLLESLGQQRANPSPAPIVDLLQQSEDTLPQSEVSACPNKRNSVDFDNLEEELASLREHWERSKRPGLADTEGWTHSEQHTKPKSGSSVSCHRRHSQEFDELAEELDTLRKHWESRASSYALT